MKRKFLSLILVFAMTVSLLTVGTGAVEPTYGDTAGHWAESSIERWSSYGIIQGSNGEFDPNGQLTCAQLATILAKLLKLPAAPSAGFSDVAADAWYADAINRCVAAGILNGNGDGTVSPTAPITRERAMVMLGRALGIKPIENPDLTKYGDAAKVSAYAQGYVAAMIEAGIVTGVGSNQIAPQDDINRASTVTILDRAIAVYADKDGATIDAKDGGLILIVAKNVKVVNAPEGTTIVAADGASGLTVNDKAVTDDQTYVVPKAEPAKPSSGSSSGGHSHTIATEWSFDDTYHWHEASCGREAHRSDKAEHTWNDGVVTTAATCTEDGSKTYTCTVCGKTKTETIAATGHNYVDGVCSVCGVVNPTDAEASINGNYYRTLSDALNTYAVSGDTVVLNKSFTVSESIQLPNKNITINLGTYTITGDTDVYVLRADTTGANVTLTGTTGGIRVNGSDSGIVKIGDDVTATVSITGGTYNTNPSAHVAVRYKATENNGIWTVEKMNWDEYPVDASVTPEGFSFTDSNYSAENSSPVTRTVHISSKDALLYYAYRFDREAAYNACQNHAETNDKEGYCIWYQNTNNLNNVDYITVVELECDIDFENETLPRGMEIYGTTFKGNGHTIKNAKVFGTAANNGNAGLFYLGEGGGCYASIENLKIDNVHVETSTTYNGNAHAGIVVSIGKTSIKDVTVTNSSAIGGKYTGAIAGFINGGSITGCTVRNCTVSGQYKIGGVVGQIGDGTGNVTNNTLTGVTLESANVPEGTTAVIGKFVGDWNVPNGNCYNNSFDGTTDPDGSIGKTENGRMVNTSAANL